MKPLRTNILIIQSRLTVAGMAFVLFFTQGIGAYAAESHFWAQRRQAVERMKGNTLYGRELTPQNKNKMMALAKMAEQPIYGSALVEKGLLNQTIQIQTPAILEEETKAPAPAFKNLSRILPLLTLHGQVRHMDIPEQADKNPDHPVVICLQDVHGHEGAQKNIAQMILKTLQIQPDAPVFLEGTSGRMPLENFRSQNQKINQILGEFFFKARLIEGPEYAGLAALEQPYFYGVEDKDLYLSNINAIRKSHPHKSGFKAYIEKQKYFLHQIKTRHYTDSLKSLDQTAVDRASGRLDLSAYIDRLSKHPQAPHLKKYPQLSRFLKTLAMEKQLRMKEVQNERNLLTARVVNTLDQSVLDELINATLSFRAGYMTPPDYYRYFESVVTKAGATLRRYPQFKLYTAYVLQADAVEAGALHNELVRFEEHIWNSLLAEPFQKQLHDLDKNLCLLEKLISFTLTTEEWAQYKAREIPIHRIPDTMARLGQADADSPDFAHLSVFEQFYQAAEARNSVLVDNLLAQMNTRSHSLAVLVAGGFHTQALRKLLRARNITVATVSPKIELTGKEKGNEYMSVFTQDKMPLDRLFKSPKISVPVSPALHTIDPDMAPRAHAVQNLKNDLQQLLQWVLKQSHELDKASEDKGSRLTKKQLSYTASDGQKVNCLRIEQGLHYVLAEFETIGPKNRLSPTRVAAVWSTESITPNERQIIQNQTKDTHHVLCEKPIVTGESLAIDVRVKAPDPLRHVVYEAAHALCQSARQNPAPKTRPAWKWVLRWAGAAGLIFFTMGCHAPVDLALDLSPDAVQNSIKIIAYVFLIGKGITTLAVFVISMVFKTRNVLATSTEKDPQKSSRSKNENDASSNNTAAWQEILESKESLTPDNIRRMRRCAKNLIDSYKLTPELLTRPEGLTHMGEIYHSLAVQARQTSEQLKARAAREIKDNKPAAAEKTMDAFGYFMHVHHYAFSFWNSLYSCANYKIYNYSYGATSQSKHEIRHWDLARRIWGMESETKRIQEQLPVKWKKLMQYANDHLEPDFYPDIDGQVKTMGQKFLVKSKTHVSVKTYFSAASIWMTRKLTARIVPFLFSMEGCMAFVITMAFIGFSDPIVSTVDFLAALLLGPGLSVLISRLFIRGGRWDIFYSFHKKKSEELQKDLNRLKVNHDMTAAEKARFLLETEDKKACDVLQTARSHAMVPAEKAMAHAVIIVAQDNEQKEYFERLKADGFFPSYMPVAVLLSHGKKTGNAYGAAYAFKNSPEYRDMIQSSWGEDISQNARCVTLLPSTQGTEALRQSIPGRDRTVFENQFQYALKGASHLQKSRQPGDVHIYFDRILIGAPMTPGAKGITVMSAYKSLNEIEHNKFAALAVNGRGRVDHMIETLPRGKSVAAYLQSKDRFKDYTFSHSFDDTRQITGFAGAWIHNFTEDQKRLFDCMMQAASECPVDIGAVSHIFVPLINIFMEAPGNDKKASLRRVNEYLGILDEDISKDVQTHLIDLLNKYQNVINIIETTDSTKGKITLTTETPLAGSCQTMRVSAEPLPQEPDDQADPSFSRISARPAPVTGHLQLVHSKSAPLKKQPDTPQRRPAGISIAGKKDNEPANTGNQQVLSGMVPTQEGSVVRDFTLGKTEDAPSSYVPGEIGFDGNTALQTEPETASAEQTAQQSRAKPLLQAVERKAEQFEPLGMENSPEEKNKPADYQDPAADSSTLLYHVTAGSFSDAQTRKSVSRLLDLMRDVDHNSQDIRQQLLYFVLLLSPQLNNRLLNGLEDLRYRRVPERMSGEIRGAETAAAFGGILKGFRYRVRELILITAAHQLSLIKARDTITPEAWKMIFQRTAMLLGLSGWPEKKTCDFLLKLQGRLKGFERQPIVMLRKSWEKGFRQSGISCASFQLPADQAQQTEGTINAFRITDLWETSLPKQAVVARHLEKRISWHGQNNARIPDVLIVNGHDITPEKARKNLTAKFKHVPQADKFFKACKILIRQGEAFSLNDIRSETQQLSSRQNLRLALFTTDIKAVIFSPHRPDVRCDLYLMMKDLQAVNVFQYLAEQLKESLTHAKQA